LSTLASTSRSAGTSGRALAILVVLAAALAPAVFLAPHPLAANASEGGFGDQRTLVKAAGDAFVDYWNSGHRDFTPGMQRVVDYWFRFHLAKAAIAAILLIVLVALGVLLWKAFLRADCLGSGRRATLASAGVFVTMLALFSMVVVMANVQGVVAPFTSVLTLLPVGASHGRLAGTLDQVRQRLADHTRTGHQTPPVLDVMISDNVRYHEAVFVMAAILAVLFIGASVMLWKRFARTGSADRRTRRVLGMFGVSSALLSIVLIGLSVANVTVAAQPVEALVNFFNGSF
jgi:lysylphosphatidylglycerol synthetase-like protein (DUF2156 family)